MSGWMDNMSIARFNGFPCKGCDKRQLRCHDYCQAYLEAAQRNKELSDRRKSIQNMERLLDDYKRRK